tara:strand:+ start:49 stop:843 length:795 start_codon:yes stop_codon:yes gene_type:complete
LPRNAAPHAAALDVSKDKFHRGLCIINALLKACAKRGWTTGTEWQIRTYVNTVMVDGKQITFRLRERCRQVERELTDEEREDLKRGRPVYHTKILQPTGSLHLTIKPGAGVGPHGWEDAPEAPLEEQLDAFCPALQRTVEALKARHHQWTLEQAQRDHQQALIEALKRHQAAWNTRAEQLWSEVGAWQQAEHGRGYLQAARRELLANGPPPPAQNAWLAWAAQVIAATDPLTVVAERDFGPWGDDHPDQPFAAEYRPDHQPRIG